MLNKEENFESITNVTSNQMSSNVEERWFIIGEFNIIFNTNEKKLRCTGEK